MKAKRSINSINQELTAIALANNVRQAVWNYENNARKGYGIKSIPARKLSQPMSKESFYRRVHAAAAKYMLQHDVTQEKAIAWAEGWAKDKGMYIHTVPEIKKIIKERSSEEQKAIDSWKEKENEKQQRIIEARKKNLDLESRYIHRKSYFSEEICPS